MDSLKNKLEKNIENFNNQVSHFRIRRLENNEIDGFCKRFINWVKGEFDLFLMNESEILKVYFPNGWFSIRNFKNEKDQELIEIKVEGKSSKACQKIMNRLELIYNHVVRFSEIKENQYA